MSSAGKRVGEAIAEPLERRPIVRPREFFTADFVLHALIERGGWMPESLRVASVGDLGRKLADIGIAHLGNLLRLAAGEAESGQQKDRTHEHHPVPKDRVIA